MSDAKSGLVLGAYDDDERTMRSHLSLVHGVYVKDVKTLAGLVECHNDQHADPDFHFQLRHTHGIPDDPAELEEWSW